MTLENQHPKPATYLALRDHLLKWFFRPDLQALETVLSAVAAHQVVQGDPIWLFVQGPSGSGKGEVIIGSIKNLVKPLDTLSMINRHSLISFNRGELGGLLPSIPAVNGLRNGIFAFKDFTTILSMREEEKVEFIGQLREIYDGFWKRNSGSGDFMWNGRITCIAACTPKLESAWAIHRDLGERFLTVRWPRIGGRELAKKAGQQRGHETEIRELTSKLGYDFVKSVKFTSLPDLPEADFERISYLAELVACLRAMVPRAPGGKREVLGEPCPEEPGRIHKSLSALVASHAALFNSGDFSEEDYLIGQRVALDSIPSNRLAIFRHFPQTEDWLNPSTLATKAHLAPSTVVWHCDEMVALGALEGREENEVKEFRLSPKFMELLKGAGLTL